jgi:hypothetical protein
MELQNVRFYFDQVPTFLHDVAGLGHRASHANNLDLKLWSGACAGLWGCGQLQEWAGTMDTPSGRVVVTNPAGGIWGPDKVASRGGPNRG